MCSCLFSPAGRYILLMSRLWQTNPSVITTHHYHYHQNHHCLQSWYLSLSQVRNMFCKEWGLFSLHLDSWVNERTTYLQLIVLFVSSGSGPVTHDKHFQIFIDSAPKSNMFGPMLSQIACQISLVQNRHWCGAANDLLDVKISMSNCKINWTVHNLFL